VQTLDDGVELLRILDTEQPRRAVVVGGGYIGLEMAEALVMRGLEVALVEAGPQPMATLDPDMGATPGSGPGAPNSSRSSAPSPPISSSSASGCGPHRPHPSAVGDRRRRLVRFRALDRG
jgi:choline dehydrogenase-like flavoprotein